MAKEKTGIDKEDFTQDETGAGGSSVAGVGGSSSAAAGVVGAEEGDSDVVEFVPVDSRKRQRVQEDETGAGGSSGAAAGVVRAEEGDSDVEIVSEKTDDKMQQKIILAIQSDIEKIISESQQVRATIGKDINKCNMIFKIIANSDQEKNYLAKSLCIWSMCGFMEVAKDFIKLLEDNIIKCSAKIEEIKKIADSNCTSNIDLLTELSGKIQEAEVDSREVLQKVSSAMERVGRMVAYASQAEIVSIVAEDPIVSKIVVTDEAKEKLLKGGFGGDLYAARQAARNGVRNGDLNAAANPAHVAEQVLASAPKEVENKEVEDYI
jgi:hypothetical protein